MHRAPLVFSVFALSPCSFAGLPPDACTGAACLDEASSLLQVWREPAVAHSSSDRANEVNSTSQTQLPEVRVQGRQLFIDGVSVHLKGINWNPVDKGFDQAAQGSSAINFAGRVDQDSELMHEAGINVIRPYDALLDREVLDKLYAKGIYVMNTVLASHGQSMEHVEWAVNQVKDHPAVLMWVVGNEWNYNGLYSHHGCQSDWGCMDATRTRLRDAAYRIKEIDPTRPVTTIYGELPERWMVDWFGDSIDIWGLNVYSGKTFGDRFWRWQGISGKPMYFGEFGADAYNQANKHDPWSGWVDEPAQAEATQDLTAEIVANSAVTGGVCIGGLLFEFNDEWWKAGDPQRQDVGGVAPGGGPWPDLVFNEEFWGLVTIDRVKRQAFYTYKESALPVPGGVATTLQPDDSVACGEPDASCQQDLSWAMNQGIHQHPEWYPGLSASSNRDDFQRHLSTLPDSPCAPPCDSDEDCPGVSASCQTDIAWAMDVGIHQHPEWYPGLTPQSSKNEFQRHLSTLPDHSCPEPCEEAADDCAALSEACENDTSWAIDVGIHEHPEWYPGLTPQSSKDDFQRHLSTLPGHSCPAPCEEEVATS